MPPRCPDCAARIPVREIWIATSFSGVACPHCHSSLEAVPWSAALVLFVAMLASNVVALLLGRLGPAWYVELGGALGTLILVGLMLSARLTRLRAKSSGVTSLDPF